MTGPEDVLIWRPGLLTDGVCILGPPKDVTRSHELQRGVPRAATWKSTARAEMSPDFPKDIGLADSLDGTGCVVVSGRVKSLLESAGVGVVEYLPLTIVNHKGRVASRDHYIVNALQLVDCIDGAASAVEMNAILPGDISACRELVLRPGSVPASALLFRPEGWRKLLLIRRGLAESLQGAGLTGLLFVEPRRYTGLF